jgi:hypothetical protein
MGASEDSKALMWRIAEEIRNKGRFGDTSHGSVFRCTDVRHPALC